MARYGARVFFHDDGTILIKQTISRTRGAEYVIDCDERGRHREAYACDNNQLATRVIEILRAAERGELPGQGDAVPPLVNPPVPPPAPAS